MRKWILAALLAAGCGDAALGDYTGKWSWIQAQYKGKLVSYLSYDSGLQLSESTGSQWIKVNDCEMQGVFEIRDREMFGVDGSVTCPLGECATETVVEIGGEQGPLPFACPGTSEVRSDIPRIESVSGDRMKTRSGDVVHEWLRQ